MKVNDIDTVDKENPMALSAGGINAFAVWLDLRDKQNKIFGARSTDGGKTRLKNVLVYASPDTTVCECCKPSALVKGNQIFVMFLNWLDGNRDMYLFQSSDGGKTFKQAQKLGRSSWALKGCLWMVADKSLTKPEIPKLFGTGKAKSMLPTRAKKQRNLAKDGVVQ
jgi:hypothetical protein